MRTSLFDIALSTGLEGFDAPPSIVDEASPDNVQDQIILNSTLTKAVLAETDINSARKSIAELTRLGDGLEGLMIEVTNVENQDDPTTEEMAALRAAALTVQRDLLTEDQRRVVDDIAEGRLEGSTEGLGDLMKNVGTKLGFAIGNFWDGVKRNFGSSGTALVKIDQKLDQLIARMRTLPDVTYERVLSKDEAMLFSLAGEVDPHAVISDLIGAIDDWFYRPMLSLVNLIDKLALDLQTTLLATTFDEYHALTEASADMYKVPLPESAKKVDVSKGKYFIFDLYDIHRSFGDRQRTVYVARPNPDPQFTSRQYDNACAVGVSFAQITYLRGRKFDPTKVTFTKEQLLNALLQLQRGVKEMAGYVAQQDIVYKAYRNYVASTSNYDNFCKNTFVSKTIMHRVSAQAGSILSLFDMTVLPVNGTVADIDKLADILKSFVYSSDLSKG